MRLARFNVQVGDLKHFAGLPIPAAAGFVAATVYFCPEPPETVFFKPALVGVTYLISLLMISTVRYPSVKQLDLGKGKSYWLESFSTLAMPFWCWPTRIFSVDPSHTCTSFRDIGYVILAGFVFEEQESSRSDSQMYLPPVSQS